MEKIRYDEFITQYHDRAVDNNRLTSCMIDVTYRCTNRCIHCYCLEDSTTHIEELSTDKIKSILAELKNAGCLWLSFSGGEPFLRDDFLDIYVHAKKLGFIISILTNATLITEEVAKVLNEYKPIQVNVSMYGSNKEKYENITRIPGSFEKFMSGIQLLKEYQINTQLQTILMTINKDDLENIQSFSEQNGFGYCKFDPFLFNDVYDRKKSYKYRVSPEEIAVQEKNDKSRHETWKRFSCSVLSRGLKLAERPLDCCSTCGISKVHIDPYGNLMGCNLMRSPSYNLNELSFKEARRLLIKKIKEEFNQKYSDDFECKDCKIRYLCNCCPGVSYIENRDINQKSAFACEIAHARQKFLAL